MDIVLSVNPRESSRARKNDERVTTQIEVPDSVLSSNLFP